MLLSFLYTCIPFFFVLVTHNAGYPSLFGIQAALGGKKPESHSMSLAGFELVPSRAVIQRSTTRPKTPLYNQSLLLNVLKHSFSLFVYSLLFQLNKYLDKVTFHGHILHKLLLFLQKANSPRFSLFKKWKIYCPVIDENLFFL